MPFQQTIQIILQQITKTSTTMGVDLMTFKAENQAQAYFLMHCDADDIKS